MRVCCVSAVVDIFADSVDIHPFAFELSHWRTIQLIRGQLPQDILTPTTHPRVKKIWFQSWFSFFVYILIHIKKKQLSFAVRWLYKHSLISHFSKCTAHSERKGWGGVNLSNTLDTCTFESSNGKVGEEIA